MGPFYTPISSDSCRYDVFDAGIISANCLVPIAFSKFAILKKKTAIEQVNGRCHESVMKSRQDRYRQVGDTGFLSLANFPSADGFSDAGR